MYRNCPKVLSNENPQNVNQSVNITVRSDSTATILETEKATQTEVISKKQRQAEPAEAPPTYPEITPNPYASVLPTTVTRDVSTFPVNETIVFLKLVIEAYMSNPLRVNEVVVCSICQLGEMITELTGCDSVEVVAGEIEVNCCGQGITLPYTPISKIWVITNGVREILKYKYSQYLDVFEKYHISLKFVSV